MEKKILMVSAAALLGMLLAAMVAFTQFSAVHNREAKREQMEGLWMFASYGNCQEGVGIREPQLSLELPENLGKEGVSVENNYMDQVIAIHIPGMEEDYLDSHPFLGRMDHIKGMRMEEGLVEISMDGVYEVESRVEGGYLYLDFWAPWQVYEKILVIDPGHGGSVSGDIKQNIVEKDLNLAIVLGLKGLLDEDGRHIGVYYTRTEDANPSFDKRLRLAEAVRADFFLSIHCHSAADGQMSEVNGTEAMYDEQKGDGSQELAEIFLQEVTASLGSKANGVFPGNRDYVLRSSKVPAVSLAVGYMTNQEELNKLKTPEYQRQAAQGIYNAILRAVK